MTKLASDLIRAVSRSTISFIFFAPTAMEKAREDIARGFFQMEPAIASFYDLTAGEIYNIEVQVIGSAGPSDWSDAGSLMVISAG